MLTKYPSTWHLPWSENYKDTTDKVLKDVVHFIGKHVVVTEKMDGENTTIYRGGKCHARSLDSGYHGSRAFVRKIAGDIGWEIPDGWRVCGENMFAKHSIHYTKLESYFLVFGVWNENNECLSWKDTLEFCDKLGLCTVPILYWGQWTPSFFKNISLDETAQEGYVVRLTSSFPFEKFGTSCAKYVRKNHIQTDEHWLRQAIVRNIVKK